MPFSEGLAAVRVNGEDGYIDKTGKFLFKAYGENFSEGLAKVSTGSNWGYMDKTGKIVIQPQFSFAIEFFEGVAHVWIGEGDSRKSGIIDKTGKYIWNPTN